jgi:peptidyl-Lys metalloendopeptidase
MVPRKASELMLEKKPPPVAKVPLNTAPSTARNPSFDETCNSTQRSVLWAAHTTAHIIAWGSALQLERVANPASNSEYLYWFGTHTSSRYTTVKNVYDDIYNDLTTDTVTYNCAPRSCGSGDVAYTFLGSLDIFLCGPFWGYPIYPGSQHSQADVVLHELTHGVSSTNDITYGASNAHRLAVNNPDDAVDNADNFAYFSDNLVTCSQLMSDESELDVNDGCLLYGALGSQFSIVADFTEFEGTNNISFQNMSTTACYLLARSGSTAIPVNEDIYITAPSGSPSTTEGYRYPSCEPGRYTMAVVSDTRSTGHCALFIFIPTDT